jgi:hypothetical protein
MELSSCPADIPATFTTQIRVWQVSYKMVSEISDELKIWLIMSSAPTTKFSTMYSRKLMEMILLSKYYPSSDICTANKEVTWTKAILLIHIHNGPFGVQDCQFKLTYLWPVVQKIKTQKIVVLVLPPHNISVFLLLPRVAGVSSNSTMLILSCAKIIFWFKT